MLAPAALSRVWSVESKNSLFPDTSRQSSDGVGILSKTMRWHKRNGKLLLWILALTIGIAITRELGAITLEFLRVSSSTQINIKSSSRYWIQGQQRIDSKDYNQKSTATERASNIGFEFPPGSDLDTGIEPSIKKHLAEAKTIEVFQMKSEVSGIYLLPMLKAGQCEFSLKFGAKAASGKYFNGELTGIIDFNIIGVCSQRKLRELLSKRMAIQIVEAIESNIRE